MIKTSGVNCALRRLSVFKLSGNICFINRKFKVAQHRDLQREKNKIHFSHHMVADLSSRTPWLCLNTSFYSKSNTGISIAMFKITG